MWTSRIAVVGVILLTATLPAATLSQPATGAGRVSAVQCRVDGGELRDCRSGRSYCRVTYADAGRPCTDGSQCQGGRCDYTERTPPPEGQTARGVCIAATDPCTCQAEVEDGHVIGLLCLESSQPAS